MRSLLIAFVATTANALQLPMQPRTAATAAVAIATPLPALAVHELAPGTAYGDVALNYDGMISAGVGFMLSAAIFGFAFDYALKFGADEGCIISGATGKEVCGRIIDHGEQGCVLSDSEGWVCSA